jgi:hypothetical protein
MTLKHSPLVGYILKINNKQGGEMNQALYAHMNNKRKMKKKKRYFNKKKINNNSSVPTNIQSLFKFTTKERFDCLFETGCHYVAQASTELIILLPLSPEGWCYRHMPPCLAKESFLKRGIFGR